MPDANPYQSPRTTSERLVLVASDPSQPIKARLSGRGLLYRCVQLTGGLEAELAWNGRGVRETIRVNGITVASKTPLWYVPHFSFPLPGTLSQHRLDVDVRLSWVLPIFVVKFCVRVDNAIVYSEGRWHETLCAAGSALPGPSP